MTPEQRLRIAEILESDAEMLFAGYAPDGAWPANLDGMGQQARKDHMELLDLATLLRRPA